MEIMNTDCDIIVNALMYLMDSYNSEIVSVLDKPFNFEDYEEANHTCGKWTEAINALYHIAKEANDTYHNRMYEAYEERYKVYTKAFADSVNSIKILLDEISA